MTACCQQGPACASSLSPAEVLPGTTAYTTVGLNTELVKDLFNDGDHVT